jgi:cytochrome P450
LTTYDFFDPALRTDPYPFFDRLRDHDPVYETDFGYWYVSRYDDITALLRDERMVAGSGVADSIGLPPGPLHDLMDTWMMSVDGPAHAKVRRLCTKVFTPRAVEALRPEVQRITDGLLDAMGRRLGDGEAVDVVREYAFPMPMEVVRLLFGSDPDEWASRVVPLFEDSNPLAPMLELADYFAGVEIPQRRAHPGDDLFSGLVVGDLSDDELVANAVLLVTAGFETTECLIANAVLAILTHADQRAILLEDPRGRARNAIEEVLRWEPPALSTTRQTTAPVEVAGRTIPAGAKVLFSTLAGNRDPSRYPDPGRFDISRPDIRPLTFGGGVHVCVGAALARMEGDVALASLFERFPDLELAEDAITWTADNPTVRRPVRLLVRRP